MDDIEDEDVRIAVRALGQMRNGTKAFGGFSNEPTTSSSHRTHSPTASSSTTHTPALSVSLASTHSTSSPPQTPPLALDDDNENHRQRDRKDLGPPLGAEAGAPTYPSLARMQSLPLVSSAIRVYDTAKTNSKVVQYTSQYTSSLLRHGTSFLPAGSGERMDEFAGGMLDRLDRYRRPASSTSTSTPASASTSSLPTTLPPLSSSSSPLHVKTPQIPGPFDARGEYDPRDYNPHPHTHYQYEGKGKGKRRYEDEQGDGDGDEAMDRDAEGEDDDMEDGGRQTVERERERERGQGRVPGWLEATSPFAPAPGPPPPLPPLRDGGGGTLLAFCCPSYRPNGTAPPPASGTSGGEVAQRSRWQAVLLEAGGLSAALSDESMRRLRYCLSWLQYATQHIDTQILILRDFIGSLHPYPPSAPSTASSSSAAPADPPPPPELTPDHLRTLTHLRSDIVHTIRQVVGVVSKYAGGALPEPARGRVRGFILDLPRRFSAEGPSGGGSESVAVAAAGGGGASASGSGTGRRSAPRSQRGPSAGVVGVGEAGSPTTSAPSSPHAHYRALHPHAHGHGGHSRRASAQDGAAVEPGRALAAAQRVLVLATESLDMMRGVTAVVSDSLDRADAWVDRLRTVGIQRGMDGLALPDGSGGEHGGHPHSGWAGATPAWAGGPPRSPGGYTVTSSTSGTHSPAAYGPTSPIDGGGGMPYASGAPSPAYGLGLAGMSIGSVSSRYSTPAPGGEGGGEDDGGRERKKKKTWAGEERDQERRMEVDG
ncbi:transcription factor Opi1-domain-containing protein [Favolaschia claudopus]|uniref:Transcription factor Opi1-domain-containing protein n=1 Tax=Favolaschia claudopus TaxID=2862362 RepID=A0AAV9ZBY2_9AGAR